MEDTLEQLTNVLRNGKAENITILDVSEISSWTDFLFIATVTSSTHLHGLLEKLEECASAAGLKKRHKTHGSAEADWDFADYGNIVVHLMSDEARRFYALEDLWKNAREIRPVQKEKN